LQAAGALNSVENVKAGVAVGTYAASARRSIAGVTD